MTDSLIDLLNQQPTNELRKMLEQINEKTIEIRFIKKLIDQVLASRQNKETAPIENKK